MKIIPHTQGTGEWLQWRNTGIGGSEAPCIFLESPYMTKRELFLSKKGRLKKDDADSEYIFSRGHSAETQMRKEIKELLGSDFAPVCVQHSDIEYMIASLDGLSPQFGVLEAKLVGKDVLRAALEKGEIPRHHWIQLQHNMIAADVDSGKWFGSTLQNNGAVVDVALDKKFARSIIDEESRFWEMILKNIVPELSEKDTLEPEDTRAFEVLKNLKAELDNAQRDYDAQLEHIKGMFKHPRVAGAGVELLTIERSGSISYSKIPEIKNLPAEYLEQFRGAPAKYVKVSFKESK